MSPSTPAKSPRAARESRAQKSPTKAIELAKTVAPKSATAPEATEILCTEAAELHLFDLASGTFIMQDQEVTAVVSEIGKWQCEFRSRSRNPIDDG